MSGPEKDDLGVPDGDGLPGPAATAEGGALTRWRQSYGASPLHLLLHLLAIVLIAWALSQSFDDRYRMAWANLAIWMVAGALLNDLVALPLYGVLDRIARAAWGRIRPAARPGEDAGTRRVVGHGHVRVPVVMSAVLLLVYFPNITHKAPIGHRFATGLSEQPDYASRWLAITAGLLAASAVVYLVRVLASRSAASRRPAR